MLSDNTLNWYAVKAFWGRTAYLASRLDSQGIEHYTQTFFPSLVFVHCSEDFIQELRRNSYKDLSVYTDPLTKKPSVIDEKEFTIFRLVTSAGDGGLEFLGEDIAAYHQGDRVRVTDGPFKGAEGYIKRIKKDRRLIVSVTGVAAVATSFIHPSLLEKIEN